MLPVNNSLVCRVRPASSWPRDSLPWVLITVTIDFSTKTNDLCIRVTTVYIVVEVFLHLTYTAYVVTLCTIECTVYTEMVHAYCFFVCRNSMYKETVHMYRFCIRRNVTYFVHRNGTYVCTVSSYAEMVRTYCTETVRTYEEMVHTYVLFLHTKKQYVPFPYFCMLIRLHMYVLCIIIIIN